MFLEYHVRLYVWPSKHHYLDLLHIAGASLLTLQQAPQSPNRPFRPPYSQIITMVLQATAVIVHVTVPQ